ncbi:MAG: methyltransferase domain-containing protein [Immundisolibacteraceae bacterium]|nr:methyltransferase domain-containing protein [Immundisolibacteraceae bacterium]
MKRVLHVGCGPKQVDNLPALFRGEEWQEIRLDIDPDVGPDIIGSITDMKAVNDADFDALFSSHNLEHLYPHEVPSAVREFARVLKPDGYALIACPDMQSVAAVVAQGNLDETLYDSQVGPIAAIDIMFGLRPQLAAGNLFMAHRTAFTQQTLAKAIVKNGFTRAKVIRNEKKYSLLAYAYREQHLEASAES